MADITLIPASAEGGIIEQLAKQVQGVPGTTDQPVLSFYNLDTELFDVDVYVEDADGASSPAATTRGLGIGAATSGGPTPSGPPTTPGAATGYTDSQIDAFLLGKADENDRFKNIAVGDPALPASAITELLKLLDPGHALERVNGKLGLVKTAAGLKLPPPMGIGAFDMGTGTLNHAYLDMYYSDYIPIEPDVAIEFTVAPGGTPNLQFTGVYDANKVFLGSIYDITVAGGNGFVAPANAAYMRIASGVTKKSFVYNAYSDITYTLGRLPYMRSVNGLFPGPDGNLDIRLGGSSGLPLSTTRTADYTLALTDADKMVPVAAASAVTVTVPDHATVPFPIGTTLYVAQDGAGQVSIAGASNVVVQTAGGLKVAGQWQDVALHKRDLNTWVLKGGIL